MNQTCRWLARFPLATSPCCSAASLTIAAVAFVLRTLPEVSPTTVALALLLIVLGDRDVRASVDRHVAAVAAMLTLNFFFLPPLGTFTIADPQNWIALFAFLVVAVIASNLSAAAQDRAREAIARRNEVTRLFDLTRDVLLTTETTGAIEALARHVARRFELSRVAICLPGDHGWRVHQGASEDLAIDSQTLNMALAKARGIVEFDARQRAYGGHVRVGPDQRHLDRAAATRHEGRRVCSPPPHPRSISARSTRWQASSRSRSSGRSSSPNAMRRNSSGRKPIWPPRCSPRSATTCGRR